MKKTKSVLCLLLVMVIAVSTFSTLSISAYTIPETLPPETQEPTVEETQEPTVVETVEPTEKVTQAPTEEVTQTPTQKPETETIYNSDKVGIITKLSKDSAYQTVIKLYWNAVEDADGYNIYMKNADKSSTYKKIGSVHGTKVTVKNLSHTTAYHFKIAAYIKKGNTIYEGVPKLGKTATQPADTDKPTLENCSSYIKISWNRNSRADGYRIYREDKSTKGKLVLYKTLKSNKTTSYTDKKVTKGRSYNYYVKAYRTVYPGKTYTGKGSTLRTVAGLSAPSINRVTTQLSRVTIDWSKSPYAEGYDIYYKADDRSSYKFLKTTKSTYLNSKHLRVGHTYKFRIKPYKRVGAKKTKVYGTYPVVKRKAVSSAYGNSVGNTYIEISLTQQRMWMYVNGKQYIRTSVVTGNQGAYGTPKGYYRIWQRMQNTTLSGPSWCVNVDYWMAFNGGIGIHDSLWRSASEYGGKTYKGNGSHGCVNTPYSAVKKIYSKASMGTPVIVY